MCALQSPSSWNLIPGSDEVTLDMVYVYTRAAFTNYTDCTRKKDSVRLNLPYNKRLDKVQQVFGKFPVIVTRTIPNLTDSEETLLTEVLKKYGPPCTGAASSDPPEGNASATAGRKRVARQPTQQQPAKRPVSKQRSGGGNYQFNAYEEDGASEQDFCD